MPTTATAPKLTKTITCRRCQGTGIYETLDRVGDCFGCQGRGKKNVFTAAGKKAHEERQARHAAVYARCEALDAALPRKDRHWVWDFKVMEENDAERYEAALARVIL